MTYLVLARKWRPDSWEKLIAQDHVTATLKNAIQYNRLAHAYLFTGPRGVGKTSAARILAKALNCEKGPAVVSCNQCSNCLEISEGRSIDVFEIDGASNRGIDEVRNLRENIRYTPAKSQYRIYIIDEVHMLTTEAFNALLKTLEEPPSHVLFIFATTEPHKVPATIISRCQRFDFRRVSTSQMVQQLRTICKEEGVEIDENALALIAGKSEGSMRDSQSILDQMISYTGSRIRSEDVIQALGLIDEELFFETTRILSEKDVPGCFGIIEKVFSGGYDLDEFLNGLSEHFRNILIVRSTGKADLLEKPANQVKRYQEISGQFQEEDLLRMIRIVAEASSALRYSENPRITLEIALVKLAKLDKTVTLEDLMLKVSRWPSDPGQGSSVIPPSDPVVPGSSPESRTSPDSPSGPDKTKIKTDPSRSVDEGSKNQSRSGESSGNTGDAPGDVEMNLKWVEKHWEDFIACLKKKKITIGSFMEAGVPIGLEGDMLEIGFGKSNGFHIDAIMRGKHLVTAALADVFIKELKFQCVKGDYGKQKTEKPLTRNEKLEQLRKIGEADGTVQKIMDEFDVEIME